MLTISVKSDIMKQFPKVLRVLILVGDQEFGTCVELGGKQTLLDGANKVGFNSTRHVQHSSDIDC